MKPLQMFLAALVCVLAAYGLPTRLVNARGDFAAGLFEPLILDARSEKLEAYAAFAAGGPVDGLILGSSRSMKIRPGTVGAALGGRWFNFSVDNAKVEDYVAIYRWTRANGPPIRSLLIGLDIEALNDDDLTDERFDRSVTFRGELAPDPPTAFLERVRVELENDRRMYADWYAAETVRSIGLHLPGRPAASPLVRFDADGYLQYQALDDQRLAGTFDLAAQLPPCIALYVQRFSTMRGLSERRRALLEGLLGDARADGVAVTIWITQVHSTTAAELTRTTRYASLHDLVARYLSTLASRYGVRTFDFADPQSFGADPDGWYDCAHIDAANADRLAAKLIN